MIDAPTTRASARFALWLACAWVLAGACFKLFAGSPNDLPPTIQDFPLLKPEWTFNLAIGIELSIVLLALSRPRVFWILLAAMFVVFDVLLVQMIQAGEESCGCFGSSVPLKPIHMLTIDTLLLAGLLVTRVWSGFPRKALGPFLVLATPLVAGLVAVPWFVFDYDLDLSPGTGGAPAELAGAGGGEGQDSGDPAEASEPTESSGPAELPDWYRFEPESWSGQLIGDLDLATLLVGGADTAWSIPAPAHVVLYRLSCDHCRQHFETLLENPILDRAVVLVNIPENADAEDVVSAVKPQGAFEYELVPLERGYGITTPVVFELDDTFTVNSVELHGKDG